MPCSSDPTSSRWNIYGVDFRKIFVLQRLDVYESDALNALISSVHEKMGDAVQSQTSQSIKVGDQSPDQRDRDGSDLATFPPISECLNSYSKDDDLVAKILGHLRPLTLQKLLLVMVVSIEFDVSSCGVIVHFVFFAFSCYYMCCFKEGINGRNYFHLEYEKRDAGSNLGNHKICINIFFVLPFHLFSLSYSSCYMLSSKFPIFFSASYTLGIYIVFLYIG